MALERAGSNSQSWAWTVMSSRRAQGRRKWVKERALTWNEREASRGNINKNDWVFCFNLDILVHAKRPVQVLPILQMSELEFKG